MGMYVKKYQKVKKSFYRWPRTESENDGTKKKLSFPLNEGKLFLTYVHNDSILIFSMISSRLPRLQLFLVLFFFASKTDSKVGHRVSKLNLICFIGKDLIKKLVG